MMRARELLALWALCVMALGCHSPATALQVQVYADSIVQTRLRAVRVQVYAPTGTLRDEQTFAVGGGPGQFALPLGFTVEAVNDPLSEQVEVDVAGLDTGPQGMPFVQARVIVTGFVAHQTRVAPVWLWGACTGVTCPANQTCDENGMCGNAVVAPTALVTTGADARCAAGSVNTVSGCVALGDAGAGTATDVPVDVGVDSVMTSDLPVTATDSAGTDTPQTMDTTTPVDTGIDAVATVDNGIDAATAVDTGTDMGPAPSDIAVSDTGVVDTGVDVATVVDVPRTCTAMSLGNCDGIACTPPPNAMTAACLDCACVVGACEPGYADCDGLASTGCEVNIESDPMNCGGCRAPCASGRICTAASCVTEVVFTTSGSWTVPPGVTSVSVVVVGGGGNADDGFNGGGGGALCYLNNVVVTPGASIPVVAGSADVSSPNGIASSFNGTLLVANGGMSANGSGGGLGGVGTGGTCFAGGSGGADDSADGVEGGGGGAAGYAGNGGNGGSGGATYPGELGGAGSGGAGGGGDSGDDGGSVGGGGVGLFGIGASGGGGLSSSGGGGGGSGGAAGAPDVGANYGGGASHGIGGSGAVRIIWGPGQSFPNNAAPSS